MAASGVTLERVVVDCRLGVERHERAVIRDREWIDLDKRCVEPHGEACEFREKLDGRVRQRSVQANALGEGGKFADRFVAFNA